MAKINFPVSTLRTNRNYTFTGRDDDLRHVHEVLTGVDKEEAAPTAQSDSKNSVRSETRPASCVLEGSAGIGKTQIALEYTYRYGSEYDAIFWLELSTTGPWPQHMHKFPISFACLNRRLRKMMVTKPRH